MPFNIFHQTANEMAGKYSGVMMWPGGEFEYNGISCTFMEKFTFGKSWKKRINTIISWLTHKKTPANLVMLYIEQPDDKSHLYGYKSNEVSVKIFSHLLIVSHILIFCIVLQQKLQ